MKIGDKVITPLGTGFVVKFYMNDKDIVKVELDGGRCMWMLNDEIKVVS